MKKSTLVLGISILAATLFSGCFHPVYWNINQDVEPESATVSGTINAITRYNAGGTEFLTMVSQEGLIYKEADNNKHGSWKKYSALPFDTIHHYDYYGTANHVGQQMISVYADTDTLYLFTASYKNDSAEGTSVPSQIYCYAKQITLNAEGDWDTAGEWTTISDNTTGKDYFPIFKFVDYYFVNFRVFSTNSVKPENRKVYFRNGNPDAYDSSARTVTYYQLSGLSAPTEISASPADSTTKNKICSVVWFDGEPMFFNSLASATNETADSDATMVYYAGTSSSNRFIYYKAAGETSFTKGNFDCGQEISALAVCSDALLIGRANFNSSNQIATGGIVKTSLTAEGIPGDTLTAFSTNAETQLAAAYFILTLLNVDPSLPELESSLYASLSFFGTGSSTSVNFANVGLWSYYPSRGNWNRE